MLNLQTSGEHDSSDDRLDEKSGFAYDPAEFTQNGSKYTRKTRNVAISDSAFSTCPNS